LISKIKHLSGTNKLVRNLYTNHIHVPEKLSASARMEFKHFKFHYFILLFQKPKRRLNSHKKCTARILLLGLQIHHDTKLSLKVKRSRRFCLEYGGLWACYRVTCEGLMQRNGIPDPVSPRSQQPNHDKSSPLIGLDNVCSPVFTCGFLRLNILYVKHYTLSRAGQLDTNLHRSQRLLTSILS
jgi:hypothetical protein